MGHDRAMRQPLRTMHRAPRPSGASRLDASTAPRKERRGASTWELWQQLQGIDRADALGELARIREVLRQRYFAHGQGAMVPQPAA